MKYIFSYLYLLIFISLTTYAKLTSEIVFIPDRLEHLWITRINDTENTRLFFEENPVLDGIWALSVQRDGPLIVISADQDGNSPFEHEAYLIDTSEFPVRARKLTHHRFDDVPYISISPIGDIVFINVLIDDGEPPPRFGIYFISHLELNKASPRIMLLKDVIARDVIWSPDNEHIAYTSADGLFAFNIRTGKTIHVSQVGGTPVFSPDGKKLAFSSRGWGFANRVARNIRIVSFPALRSLQTINGLIKHSVFTDLKWSPNGKHLVYNATDERGYHHIAVPLGGGQHEEILNDIDMLVYDFDWSSRAYSVDPENRLTTVWGKLKTEITK